MMEFRQCETRRATHAATRDEVEIDKTLINDPFMMAMVVQIEGEEEQNVLYENFRSDSWTKNENKTNDNAIEERPIRESEVAQNVRIATSEN